MRRKPVVWVALLSLIGALGVVLAIRSIPGSISLPRLGPACTVRADGQVTLDAVQMTNAATITAVGLRRNMPERAVVIALATAFQESTLENIDYGDRDSVGLFQQRPSQGWGTVDEIMDPRYSAERFYASLKKVKGWEKMRVTDAAQKVQRSAYPEAYEKWADESEVLAKALTGRATRAVECTVSGEPVLRGAAAAAALAGGLRLDWGQDAPELDEAETGLTVPVGDTKAGWRYAHWLVANAGENGLERVRFADLEWVAPSGRWQPVTEDLVADETKVVASVYR